jgi:hypothetical protein
VIPAAGGCDAPLDLLLAFVALGGGAEVLGAEFTVLAFADAVRVFALTPAGCTLELVGAAVVVFFTCAAAPLAEVPLATDAVSAVGDFAAVRGSTNVDKIISSGAFSAGCATVSGGVARARAAAIAATDGADVATATGCIATLLATGAAAGIKFEATLAGAGAEAAVRACARAAACASAEAPAVDLVLSSSNGGKLGKMLSGT